MTLAEAKRAARRAAAERRAEAHARHLRSGRDAAALLSRVVAAEGAGVVSAYAPIRDEADPMPVLAEAAARGAAALPVVEGPGLPLRFRRWRPGIAMVTGTFGVAVPEEGEWLVPDLLIVPCLAFDRRGVRLGYGGGFYDRTLAALRAEGPVRAIGFAYAGQEVAALPADALDARLDLVVTESEVIDPHG